MTDHRSPITKKITLPKLQKLKAEGKKFAVLTAYDFSMASAINDNDIEVILVGDSLGMTIQGHNSTLPVTLDDIIYHTKCVIKGAPLPLIMVDMPFATYSTTQDALNAAAQLMRVGAEIVKLEGKDWLIPIIAKLSEQGIPVCAHFGLTPQFMHQLGGFKVQGRTKSAADDMLNNAKAAEAAGAKMILLECVPTDLATKITQAITIPVIGIGAGKHTDAQVLVIQDILGLTKQPARFAKNYLAQHGTIQTAIKTFGQEVRDGLYPEPQHSFES
ncbi:MAG: 3-methyl-2-oxobutanoate hydroxymethyltransferase [Hyphomicrobiales bacterium]|nr:MAG: 3-methyl-2-oxobutanoate hydroxymethyltransferase [Hyphomicrobiales bacterium]